MTEIVRNLDILTQLPVPEMSPVQLQQFNLESLLARPSGNIDPLKAAIKLKYSQDQEILTIDIGGTALKGLITIVKAGGVIEIDESQQIIFGKIGDGGNYLEALLKIAETYSNLQVAVCSAGVVENNTLITCPNAPALVEPLKRAGNFSGIFKRLVPLMNDAEAVVVAATVGVAMRDQRARPTIGYIKSGGIGGASIDALGNRTSLEPGHIVVANPTLNPNNVNTPCNLFPDWNHVCLERIAASGAGIEPQWKKITGETLSGKEIAEKMYGGDFLALQLYNTSALISAHIIEGIRTSLNFPVEDTVVVLSGGAFKTYGMVDRIRQILTKHGEPLELIRVAELGFSNANMAGLAISALMVE